MSAAPLHFAPEDIRNKWRELASLSALQAGTDHLKKTATRGAHWLDVLGTALEGMQTVITPRSETIRAAEAQLMKRILGQQFLALGFEAPRKLTSNVVEIPSHFWRGIVRWEDSELICQSLHFVEVRLVPSHLIPTAIPDRHAPADTMKLEAMNAGQNAPASVGRPSIKEHITDAFNALHQKGQIRPHDTARSHYPLVRQWLRDHHPDLRVTDAKPSDEGIRAHFTPLFEGISGHRKQ